MLGSKIFETDIITTKDFMNLIKNLFYALCQNKNTSGETIKVYYFLV
jgi:hypothetical protein